MKTPLDEQLGSFKMYLEENFTINNKMYLCKFHQNYCAIVKFDKNGNEIDYKLKISDDENLFFDTTNVKIGDIIIVKQYDYNYQKSYKDYYRIKDIRKEYITLIY